MRQITHGEKERIKQQALSRISGKAEIAFGLSYFNSSYPSESQWQYWWEQGFVGDISFGAGSSTVRSDYMNRRESDFINQYSGVPVLGSNNITRIDYARPQAGMPKMERLHSDTKFSSLGSKVAYAKMIDYATVVDWEATITFPADYSKGFFCTQGDDTKNRKFYPRKPPAGVAVHDTIYCPSIVIRSIDGQPLPYNQPNVYDFASEPILTVDGWKFNLTSVSYEGFWLYAGYLWPTFGIGAGYGYGRQPAIAGAGTVDPMGFYSRRRDHAFRYMTTGNLRLYKLWPEVA